MCGRFVSAWEQDELIDAFDIEAGFADLPLPPDFNLAPTKLAPVVLARSPRESPGAQAVRQLRNLRWGLVPAWLRSQPKGAQLINARAETVAIRASFRSAFETRRALVPANGFYEWLAVDDPGSTVRKKQPYYLTPVDGAPLVMAGIYELWKNPNRTELDAAWLATFAIITTSATDDVGRIHDRMPMVVEGQHWDDWLNPQCSGAEAQSLMSQQPAFSLDIFPVSRAVNKVANNSPLLNTRITQLPS